MTSKPLPAWVPFLALSLLFFLVSAGTFSSLGVVLPAMVDEMHWSWTEAGLGYTLLGVACGLSSLAPAVFIRKVGVRGAIAAGTLLCGTGFAGLALTHSIGLYLVSEILIGVGFSLTTTVPGVHVITGLFQKRSTMLGAYFTIGGLGQVAGPMMYVAINAATHQWRYYWWVFVVACAGLGAFAALTTSARHDVIDPASDRPPENLGPADLLKGLQAWTVRHALKTTQFYVIVGGYTMYLLVNTTAHGFAVEHLRERGIDPKYAAGMLSLEALIGAIIAVGGGIAGEKVSPKALMSVALGALVIGMTALAYAHGYGLMLVYALGIGIGYGLSFIASTMLLLNYFGKRANLELFSIMSLISTLAAVGPAFGGWARDTLGGFAGVFLLCALATLLMLFATLFMTPPDFARLKVRPRRKSEARLTPAPAHDPV